VARPDPKKLRAEALDLVERGKIKKAIEVYRALEMAEPGEGSHPHKLGELQQREGDSISALAALVRASEKYARAGFLVKAIAVCKLILRIEPEHREAQERFAALNKARTHAGVPQDAGAASRALSAGRSLTNVPLAALSATAAIAVAPGIDEIELDDDVVIVEDDGQALTPEERARVKGALAETPFVAVLGEAALARLIDAARLIDLAPDEVLFRQGDPGDALYVVESGEVVAMAEQPKRALARLGDGAVFGEMALLTDQPRSATIVAAAATRLVAFDRKAVGDTLALEPRATTVLVGFLRRRLVANLVASSPLFAPFPPEDRRALASRFRLSEASEGAVLVKQGDRARGLYVVLAGSTDVVRDDAPVARLGAGDVFGEISLLEGVAVATVRARERCLLLVLPAADFREIIMTHPHVLEVVTALADERKRATVAFPGAGGIDLGLDLHLDLV
jgi:CRP-like cAMP-binding protein